MLTETQKQIVGNLIEQLHKIDKPSDNPFVSVIQVVLQQNSGVQ